MKRPRHTFWLKSLALALGSGMAFASLNCVSRAADVLASGLTFGGVTGAFGFGSPSAIQVGAGIGFVRDVVTLIR